MFKRIGVVLVVFLFLGPISVEAQEHRQEEQLQLRLSAIMDYSKLSAHMQYDMLRWLATVAMILCNQKDRQRNAMCEEMENNPTFRLHKNVKEFARALNTYGKAYSVVKPSKATKQSE